jgi:hypothetical protein
MEMLHRAMLLVVQTGGEPIMTDERHWWACAVNAPRPEWVGPCDCDLSRSDVPPDSNDESGQWSGECKMNDHEACDGTTPGWPCECLCHESKEKIMNDERCPICLCVTHVGPHGAGVCYPPEDEDHTIGSQDA